MLYCAFQRPPSGAGSISFQPDWKQGDEGKIRDALKLAHTSPSMMGRTRTAIDSDSGGAAFDDESGGALFSQIAIIPDGLEWVGEMILPADQNAAAILLDQLQTGCMGVGKTKAMISAVKIEDLPHGTTQSSGPAALTLISEAVLLRQEDLGSGDLKAAYAAYFAKLGLTLHDFYATQSLKGHYLSLRYPIKPGEYRPWLVTDPGSAFLVEAKDGDGQKNLEDILKKGLPPNHDDPSNWLEFPFGRENGFGHVQINTAAHDVLKTGVPLP